MAPANLKRLRKHCKRFADFDLTARQDFLATWNADYAEAMAALPRRTATFFATDGSGGQLAVTGPDDDDDRRPVLLFGSEGELEVLGENFDDFLAVAAGRITDDKFAWLETDESFRKLVVDLGIKPHERPEERLEWLARGAAPLAEWFWGEVRARVGRDMRIEIAPHERVGDIALGASLDTVTGRGAMYSPPWSPTTAFFRNDPCVIDFEPATRAIARVSIYASVPIASVDGFEPFFKPADEVERWARERDADVTASPHEISLPRLGITIGLSRPWGRFAGAASSITVAV